MKEEPGEHEVDLNAGESSEKITKFTRNQKLFLIAGGFTLVLLLTTWAAKSHVPPAKQATTAVPSNGPAEQSSLDALTDQINKNLHGGDPELACTAVEMGTTRPAQAGSTEVCVPTDQGVFVWRNVARLSKRDLEQMRVIAQMPGASAAALNARDAASGGYPANGQGGGGQPMSAPAETESEAASVSSVVLSFRKEPVGNDAASARKTDEDSRNASPKEGGVEQDNSSAEDKKSKKVTYDFDSATGKMYRLFEGRIIACTLINRLNGAFSGPVECVVAQDVLSKDHSRVLVPQGSKALGEVSQVNSSNQERLFVAFHRLIMPDGYSVSLDQFKGLNQIGETGLRDKVNYHYWKVFGASAFIAAVGALGNLGNYGNSGAYSASDQYRTGFTMNMAQSSMQAFNKFLNVLPTFTITEGNRLLIYVSSDLLLPDYKNHTMPEDL